MIIYLFIYFILTKITQMYYFVFHQNVDPLEPFKHVFEKSISNGSVPSRRSKRKY